MGPRMTNADLVAYLNEELGLTGASAVTSDVIRQWVLWDVLPRATSRGRGYGRGLEWKRSGRDLHRARQLARWRDYGIRRESAVIAQSFLEWRYPDFDHARRAIIIEFKRARALALKRFNTTADISDFAHLSSVGRRALRNQLGPLDGRFADTQFDLCGETYAAFLSAAIKGEGNIGQLTALLTHPIENLSPACSALFPESALQWFIGTTMGMFGEPTEIANSAQFTIEIASEREWRIARIATRRIFKMLRHAQAVSKIPGLDKSTRDLFAMLAQIQSEISIGRWAISMFAQILHGVRSGIEFPPEMRVNSKTFGQIPFN